MQTDIFLTPTEVQEASLLSMQAHDEKYVSNYADSSGSAWMLTNAACYCIGQNQNSCLCNPSLLRILAVFVTVPCLASSAIVPQPAELSEDIE